MNNSQIPGIAAALICALIAYAISVNPAVVIAIMLTVETATYLIGRSKQSRKHRSARQIAYRPIQKTEDTHSNRS